MKYMFKERIALQTIIYGETFEKGLEPTLEEIRKLGFSGIEVFQTPSKLGSPQEFEQLLKKHSLTLLGMTGGSLADRITFCKELSSPPQFLYVQSRVLGKDAFSLGENCKLALHPHQYSPVDSYRAAVTEARSFPPGRVTLLPDSAHLFLSAENMGDILAQDGSQIQFIHLKDWTPEYGTSMFSYARGFCELGAGIVFGDPTFRARLMHWHQAMNDRWIIVEQDSSSREPKTSCAISLNWLWGAPTSREELRNRRMEDFSYPSIRLADELTKESPGIARSLLNTLLRSNLDSLRDVKRHYHTILEGISQVIDLTYATIWEISPREGTAILGATWQRLTAAKCLPSLRKLELRSTLGGLAMDKQEAMTFPDIDKTVYAGRGFADRQFLTDAGLHSMVSIPIPNYWNPNQPEVIVNLFPQTLADVWERGAFTRRMRTVLSIIKPYVSTAIERAWEQEREEIREELGWVAAQSDSVRTLLEGSLDPIRRHLHCRDVEIHLVGQGDMSLELIAPKPPEPKLTELNVGLAGQVWEARKSYNSGTVLATHQRVPGSHLLTPIYRQGTPLGEVLGVIWCRNKLRASNVDDFSVTDELTLDAAQAALVPHLERMIAAERRIVTMTRINHELKDPLTIFRHATTAAIKEMKHNRWQFSKDHLDRLRTHLELIEQTVAKSAFLRPDVQLVLKKKQVLLFRDIIDPAIVDLSVHLADRRFSAEAIDVVNKSGMPTLYVDMVRFQQVVFNILTNAIKYARPEPDLFRVQIAAQATERGTNLFFRDNGIGIPRGMEEKIFLEGVRGPNAERFNAPGDGLGLFIVREILKAHEASIRAERSNEEGFVTQFVVFLPRDLTVFPFPVHVGEQKA